MKTLVTILSIALFVVTGKAQSDSVKCYTKEELRKIAIMTIKKQECENLLSIVNKQLTIKMEIIDDQDGQIRLLKKVGSDKDSIIVNKDSQLTEAKKLLKKEHRRKNWTKVGWVTSVAVLITLLVLKR